VSNENQHKLLTMRPTVLGVLFSFFIFSSCNEEPGIQNQEALAAQPLTGTWEWIRTTGGIGAQIYETPSSMEKTVEWRFLHDMKYLRYENGVIQSQGTFSLTKKACIHYHCTVNFQVNIKSCVFNIYLQQLLPFKNRGPLWNDCASKHFHFIVDMHSDRGPIDL
jgi:hypothetical protein